MGPEILIHKWVCNIVQHRLYIFFRTVHVGADCSDGAAEAEDHEDPTGRVVAADEVTSPVLHVRIHGRFQHHVILIGLAPKQ